MPKTPEITETALQLFRHAEEGLLASIMLAGCFVEGGIQEHNEALQKALKLVRSEHFHYPDHARYYKAMERCHQPDIIGVLKQLSDDKQLKRNDRDVLLRMHQETATCFDLMHYAQVVVDLWEKRTGESNRRRGFSV